MKSLGPIVGHTRWRDTRIWVRSAAGVDDKITLTPAEPGLAIRCVDLGRDVHRLELSGLSPGTDYEAVVKDLGGAPIGLPARFRTGVPGPSSVRLWFGSCYNRVCGDEIWDRMYKRMLATRPDSLFLIGDQVYADEPTEWPDKEMPFFTKFGAELEDAYESLYERAWTSTRVARVLASVPTLMTWDDHELFDDWGSDPRHRRTTDHGRRQFETIEQVYRRYERAHGPGDAGAPLDFGTTFGPVAVYTMDLRSERGLNAASPIVGEAQHRRLADWIAALDTNVRLLVVVTSVPITFVNKKTITAGMDDHKDLDLDLADQWNYPGRAPIHHDNRPDLARLLRTLFAWQAQGRQVIVIGGDVHMAYGHELRSGDKKILSFATSPLSCQEIDQFEREILEAGILYKDHKVVDDVRGSRLVESVIFDANFGELVYENGSYSFSIVTCKQSIELHRGKL